MAKVLLKDKIRDITGYDDKKVCGLILSGKVYVNENVVSKIGIKINDNDKIRIKEDERYVSRGAYKLLSALNHYKIEIENKICLDVGSSTGGFTQVLLEHNAKKVYAVDCGKNQLDYRLRIDSRVISIEERRIQDIKKDEFGEKIDLFVCDVSFTSIMPIIKHCFFEFEINEGIVLIKPQFEYERLKKKLELSDGFDGVVKNDLDRQKIINQIKKEIIDLNLKIFDIIESDIKGTYGNVEYLCYIKKY